MHHPTTHFFDLTPDALTERCLERGWPKFRANQIMEWVYQKGVSDPQQMTTLSKREREQLAAEMTFLSGDTIAHQRATDGTQKLLIEWSDTNEHRAQARWPEDVSSANPALSLPTLPATANPYTDLGTDPTRQTECVMIPAEDRRTACISSQVGCPVGCRFCASGLSGLDGNLSAGRIVEQAWRLGRLDKVGRISNVVFMGMGEPLANFKAVTNAVRTLASPWGMGISARKITVSTVGMHKAIERLADELELPITLALSLHAPNDDLRRSLIPWAEYTSIDQLFEACDAWFKKTGREITLEYTLLRGVNDRPHHAKELADVAKRLRATVNLIRYNEVEGLPYERPVHDDVHAFQKTLLDAKVRAHIRASRGRDIAAACGQLRHETAAQ
ncbi:MAG: 23S rRNA (adenine(2503)-C(2))-methyltransferase RlmN [Phycisphaerales bacterium]